MGPRRYEGLVLHWVIRKILRWFCAKTKQQCSGKMRSGYADMYCSKTAFHVDTCTDFKGNVFKDINFDWSKFNDK